MILFERLWQQKRGVLLTLLLPVSFFYRLGVHLKNWAYDRGFFRSWQPDNSLVISVGNLSLGGTGKTPFTLLLAKQLEQKTSLALLTRGYGSQAEYAAQPLVLTHKHLPKTSECGDEPWLLASHLAHTRLYVNRNRCASAKLAASEGARCLLLDDGFQHRKLKRNLDIVLLDAAAPFGNGFLFPRGNNREPPTSLARAHLIVLTHVQNHTQFIECQEQVRLWSTAPLIGTKPEFVCLPSQHKAGVFCGIANPHRFLSMVKELDLEVIEPLLSRDHKLPSQAELEEYADRCRRLGAEALFCTEKDFVKLEQTKNFSLPIIPLPITLKIVEGKNEWEHFLQKTNALLF